MVGSNLWLRKIHFFARFLQILQDPCKILNDNVSFFRNRARPCIPCKILRNKKILGRLLSCKKCFVWEDLARHLLTCKILARNTSTCENLARSPIFGPFCKVFA